MPTYYYTQPSKSLADRLHTAEFDDAVLEQSFWNNPRYKGCKVISKEINNYTPLQIASDAETGIGFASIIQHGPTLGNMIIGVPGLSAFTVGGIYTNIAYINSQPQSNLPGIFKVNGMIPNIIWQGDTINPTGLNPNITRETTALYIANTVIGGTEDDQFATIKNHSYININQILLIDHVEDTVQLIDKQAEDFIPFHSFITNDFPTGESFSIKLIDESIANNLKGPNQYKVKMNKGFLLKTFDFKMDLDGEQLTENNSMYLYRGGTKQLTTVEGNYPIPSNPVVSNNDKVRFKYGTIETIGIEAGGFGSPGEGHIFARDRIGPSFALSSIIENKFTQQYYSGSYGLINEPPDPISGFNEDILKISGLGSASKFIGIDTLDFLLYNNINASLNIQEKTELHLTFFEGTKDFSSGYNDERSISTFEIDNNQSSLTVGTNCHDYLPLDHELYLKGNRPTDVRNNPLIPTFQDDISNAYLVPSSVAGGCVQIGDYNPSTVPNILLQRGINVDFTDNANIYVQGGILGPVGYQGVLSSSDSNYGESLSGSMSSSNYYSGSFSYQLSFLDKDHTLITNLDKTAELFDGIGTKGILLIPNNTIPKIKNNIYYYLQRAGILPTSPNALVQIA
jgi:hypothetical protein